MTEFGLLTLFLFLHVGAAIIAFGPTFAFPLIGAQAAKDPTHAGFAIRVSEALEEKLVLPFAISMPFTGVGLIYFGHFNLADKTAWWLDIGIVLYAIAITVAVARQRPAIRRMVHLTSGGPAMGAGGPPPGAGGPSMGAGATPAGGRPPSAGAGGPEGGRPAGPPPEIRELAKQIQRNGQILGVLIVLIVLLMVSKPQF